MDTVKKIEIVDGTSMCQSVVFKPADAGRLVETYRAAMSGHPVKVYSADPGVIAIVTTHTTRGNWQKHYVFG